jgi:hypothetical protein
VRRLTLASGLRRASVAWAIALPLAVGSWLGGHCLAYLLVAPGAEHHMGMHAEHGHAWLGYAPALAIWGLALLLAGLVLCVAEGVRGRRPPALPVRLFALLPPLGFTVQEHAERLIGSGAVPLDLVTEPTFLMGLALQLPFSLAALLLTRALYAVGFGAGRVLAGKLALRVDLGCAAPSLSQMPVSATLVSPSLLALGHGQRAPPSRRRS